MNTTETDSAFADVLHLLEETRSYVLETNKRGAEAFEDPQNRLKAIQASSHLTEWLTTLMSWLMWHKAVNAGEIDEAELQDKTADLFEGNGPTPLPIEHSEDLPPDLEKIVAESQALQQRLAPTKRG